MPKIFLLFSFAIFTISNTPSEETSSVDMFYYVSRFLLFSIWMNQKKCHLLDIWRKSEFHFGHFMPTFVIIFVILYAFRSSYMFVIMGFCCSICGPEYIRLNRITIKICTRNSLNPHVNKTERLWCHDIISLSNCTIGCFSFDAVQMSD